MARRQATNPNNFSQLNSRAVIEFLGRTQKDHVWLAGEIQMHPDSTRTMLVNCHIPRQKTLLKIAAVMKTEPANLLLKLAN